MKRRKQPKITFPTQVSSAETESELNTKPLENVFRMQDLPVFLLSLIPERSHTRCKSWSEQSLVLRSQIGAGDKVMN